MRWYLVAMLNTMKQMLPLQAQLRAAKRKFIPYSTDIDAHTLDQGLDQVAALIEDGMSLQGKRLLELGTGWQPVIPLLFSLAGCREVMMVDAQRLMDAASFSGVCRKLTAYADVIGKRLGLAPEWVAGTLTEASAAPFDQALARLRLKYVAPCDARHTGLADGAIDVVTSRAVLEHIRPHILEELFCEFRRILAPDGKMCHVVDNSDHWRQVDPSISFANFLQYSDRVWALAGINPLDYMNRLRHSDYVALLARTGFEVCIDRSEPHAETLRSLSSLKLAARFGSKSPEDLAIINSLLVARKTAAV
jgi:SAM-dependent methyltransferase